MPELASAPRAALDAFDWAGPSTHARLVGFDVEFRTTDRALSEYLHELYAPSRIDGRAAHVLSLATLEVDDGTDHVVDLDGRRVLTTPAPSVAFAQLLYEANRQAIDETHGPLLLHASAASRDGAAVLFPAPMGAGKSTLVAALVRHGLAYLTDELVAIDRSSGLVLPYPKFVSLAPVGGGVLPDLVAAVPEPVRRFVGDHRLVPPDAIRPGAVSAPAPPRLIVVPRYERDAPLRVERMDVAEAVVAIAEQTYHLARDPGSLEAVAGLVERVPTYRMVSGRLDDALDAVLRLLDEVSP